MRFRPIIIALVCAGLVGLGFFVGRIGTVHSRVTYERSSKEDTSFINPLLDCSEPGTEFQELQPFKKTLSNRIEVLRSQGKLSEAAVYFRDLNNGPWIGLNERTFFAPASLLKVPLAMAHYYKAIHSPGVLDEAIAWHDNPAEPMHSPLTLKEGESYSVRELVQRMLVHSDNGAALLLSKKLSDEDAVRPYKELEISEDAIYKEDYTVRVKDYASFFRILYNASFAGRQGSTEILEMLAQSDFTLGVRAGVPSEIPVAHKYGWRMTDALNQLHDCGIIYYPGHPYILCVLTRGERPDALAESIADISKLVYEEVHAQLMNP